MAIRSKGLVVLSLALLASAGGLATLLRHDGIGVEIADEHAVPGESVVAKGHAAPFVAPPTKSWDAIRARLGNLTYRIDTGDANVLVLATGPDAHADAGTVIVTGDVLLRIAHPDGSGRQVLVLRTTSWTTPILFG